MATISQPMPARLRLRAKVLLFAFVGLMMAYVLYHNESFLIHRGDPVWSHYQPFKWWLLPHGLAGCCALLLGPLQFSDRLRQRYLKFHRVVGWIYVSGAMVLAPLGTYIQYFEERMGEARSFTLAAAADAALLLLTTSIALWFILHRQITQHRQWMTRSYAVALIFLEVRVIGGLTGWDATSKGSEIIVWMCVIFAVPLADIVLQWQDFRHKKPALEKKRAAAA